MLPKLYKCKYCNHIFNHRSNRDRHVYKCKKYRLFIKGNFSLKLPEDIPIYNHPSSFKSIETRYKYYFKKLYIENNNIQLLNKRKKTLKICTNYKWVKVSNNNKFYDRIYNQVWAYVYEMFNISLEELNLKKSKKIFSNTLQEYYS
jgi:hypothetical protein